MTRVDVVAVEMLNKEHLAGNHKEITRPFTKMSKRIEKHGVDKAIHDVKVPNKYVLGGGHEKFFFDKLYWVWKRRMEIVRESKKRGVNINMQLFGQIQRDLRNKFKNTQYWNDYSPTHEDIYVNMSRLVKNHSKNNADIREELER